MSQFGAKNAAAAAAWARAPGAQQLNPNLFTGQVGLAHQFASMPQAMQLGAAGLSSLAASGVLPVNAAAFSQPTVSLSHLQQAAAQHQAAAVAAGRMQQQQQTQAVNAVMQQQQQQKNQRAFVGIVTKMQDNYGFVDDDVFFQVNVVRGAMPRIGDRVMVEANYNQNMPFKWNAFRIQLLPHQDQQQLMQQQQQMQPMQQQQQASGGGGGNRPRESDRWGPPTNQQQQQLPPQQQQQSNNDYRMSTGRDRSPPPMRQRRSPPPPMRERRQSPPPRRSSPALASMRRRSPSPRRHGSVMSSSSLKRERSPRVRSPPTTTVHETSGGGSRSPPRRRQRIIPRYVVQVPKTSLDSNAASVMEMKKRYANMYIPSDFFHASFSWLESIRLDQPLSLNTNAFYHVMHKDVDPPSDESSLLDPPDADNRFSAKVVLLSTPTITELRRKAYGLQDDGTLNEDVDPVPMSRLISFLVGMRGKSEVMAIGGAWSPSLDGADPARDPRVLIRTAIRTCLALTGIDLSNCTQWYKFLDVHYNRIDKERVDTVVILLPDVTSIAPTRNEFEHVQRQLVSRLDQRLGALDAMLVALNEHPAAPQPSSEQSTVDDSLPPPTSTTTLQEDADDDSQIDPSGDQTQSGAIEPTHWSKIDVKALKVVELRQELEARGLDKKGVKNILAARLQDAIDLEKATATSIKMESDEPTIDNNLIEMNTESSTVDNEKPTVIDETELEKIREQKEKEIKDKKSSLERHYALPKDLQPSILVYPNRSAKGGKFECKVMTLSALLDYRQDDNKEHSFEVAMFAEAFNEMLIRQHAFGIYKALNDAVDKDTEKRMKEEAEQKKKAEENAAMTVVENSTDDTAAIDNGETMNESIMATIQNGADSVDEKKKSSKSSTVIAKDESKMTTIIIDDAATFASFAYFDQNLCGYLFERDTEEILNSLGLHLSRAQIQRLLKKVVSRDSINYRKLTDVVVFADTKEIKSAPFKSSECASISQLAIGNNELSVIGRTMNDNNTTTVASTPDVTKYSTVIYQGSVIDVAQNLQQLRRMENEQRIIEQRNVILEKELKSLKETREILEKKKRRCEDDVDKYKKRLHDAEKCLKNSQDDTVQLKTAMQECKKMGEKIAHLVDKVMPSTSKKSPKKDTKKADDGTVKSESADECKPDTELAMDELMVQDEITDNTPPEQTATMVATTDDSAIIAAE